MGLAISASGCSWGEPFQHWFIRNRIANRGRVDASEPALNAAVAGANVSETITSRTAYREFYGLLKETPLPVSRDTGVLLYMLVRATRTTSVLEFGTWFGLSKIYLAKVLPDNGGGGVITTELEASKVERARENLTEAGLIGLVETREGDALQTLATELPEMLDKREGPEAPRDSGDPLSRPGASDWRLFKELLTVDCPQQRHSWKPDLLSRR